MGNNDKMMVDNSMKKNVNHLSRKAIIIVGLVFFFLCQNRHDLKFSKYMYNVRVPAGMLFLTCTSVLLSYDIKHVAHVSLLKISEVTCAGCSYMYISNMRGSVSSGYSNTKIGRELKI